MSTPISNAMAQAIIDQGKVWFEGGLSKCEAEEITAALTELLALRAEVERLRAVEQAVRNVMSAMPLRCPCCWAYGRHVPTCEFSKLAAALDAKEGSKP